MPMFGPSVSADRGGIAAGRDVHVHGPSEADIKDIVRRTLAQESSKEKQIDELSQALGIRDQAVALFFRTLEEKDIPPERWAETFAEIAQQHLRLIEEVRVLHADDPAVLRLRDEALAALEKGDDAKAEEALIAARAMVRKKRERLTQALAEQAVEEAKYEGALGDLAMKHLDYQRAAQHYADAAALMSQSHNEERLAYLDREAKAHYRQGDEFGDNEALRTAIERYRALVDLRSRDRAPLQWAGTQNNLGVALANLGEGEADVARLQEAVTAFRETLAIFTREGAPLKWAMTQNNLGGVLFSLGRHESDLAFLKEAAQAFRLALREYTRERVPLDWAMTQNNLGNVLAELGKRQAGTARLEEAVAAYRAALEVRTRARAPLEWAMTQSNLGNVLRILGERRNDREYLEKAVTACLEALKENTRERVPRDWAMTQINLGNALKGLGTREGDPKRLEAAVQAYRAALDVFERAGATYYIRIAKSNLEHAHDLLRHMQAARL